MTLLQKFTEYVESLDGQERAVIEATLASMMERGQAPFTLTPEQEAESERRYNDKNRKMADPAKVNALLGRNIAL